MRPIALILIAILSVAGCDDRSSTTAQAPPHIPMPTSATMTLDEFAAVTQRIIARDGFHGFQPTVCIPSRHEIAVLVGVPRYVDMEAAAISWAVKKAGPDEEVLVAFAISSTQFKIVRIAGSEREEGVYVVE